MKKLLIMKTVIFMLGITGVQADDYSQLNDGRDVSGRDVPVIMYDPDTQQPIVVESQPSRIMAAPQVIKVERYAVGNTDTGVDMDNVQRLLGR